MGYQSVNLNLFGRRIVFTFCDPLTPEICSQGARDSEECSENYEIPDIYIK